MKKLDLFNNSDADIEAKRAEILNRIEERKQEIRQGKVAPKEPMTPEMKESLEKFFKN